MINKLKAYCIENNIPIITDESLNYIKSYIKEYQVKDILEIGTAYGYSAISFSLLGPKVDTFERNTHAIKEASKWIKSYGAEVQLYPFDALEYDDLNKMYDLIFIDAAKAQYIKFFEKFKSNLKPNGVIICDNISFHNLKINEVKNRGTKNLLKRIEQFKQFLSNNKEFNTELLPIGDGLSVSKRV